MDEEVSSSSRIDRQSSIEKEPRTLGIHQIEFAREAALCVVNTKSLEEALRIFTQGLEPVPSCAERSGGLRVGGGGGNYDNNNNVDDHHVERFPSSGLRDIVSAPF